MFQGDTISEFDMVPVMADAWPPAGVF